MEKPIEIDEEITTITLATETWQRIIFLLLQVSEETEFRELKAIANLLQHKVETAHSMVHEKGY